MQFGLFITPSINLISTANFFCAQVIESNGVQWYFVLTYFCRDSTCSEMDYIFNVENKA